MDTLKKCVLSAGKPVSIKFLVLGGGGILGFFGGECRFYFYGRADFSEGISAIFNRNALQSECWKGVVLTLGREQHRNHEIKPPDQSHPLSALR